MENGDVVEQARKYAGFWRRFAALIIDCVIVSIVVFPFVLLIGVIAPDYIVVSAPFGLFTTTQVIESEKTEEKQPDGSVWMVETKLVEETCLGKWTYLYRDTIKHTGGQQTDTTTRELLDPETKLPAGKKTAGDYELVVLLIYLILMESSKFQASLGKLALGLKVVDKEGQKLTVLRALGRNLSKVFSVFTLMIGFMMAGWTKNKQALHDMVAGCYVVIEK